MGHLIFTLKVGLATVVLIMLMQIKIDPTTTVEKQIEHFVRTSSLTSPAREVAQGGFSFMKATYHWTSKKIDSFFSKNFSSENSPGRRKITELKRSMGFQKEMEKKKEAISAEQSSSEESFNE